MKKTGLLLALVVTTLVHAQDKTATVTVNLANKKGTMKPIWAWFGYDEPNYTYMKDGKKLLSEIAALSPEPVHIRVHSLLVTGDGTPALKWGSTNAYTEDAAGNPIYNWRIVDSIFDTYVNRGLKPLAQIGFMPKALSVHPEPYQHHWKPGDPYSDIFTGWAYPPKDYTKWGNLVYEWVKHEVQRYGRREVESWYWEVWNEPNSMYWRGTQQEFFKLYDYAADGVKRALPTAKIGGTDITAGGIQFQKAFIRHCLRDTNYATGEIGAPLDLVLFHAKGSPQLRQGRVVMGIKNQLNNIADNLKLIASFPELKHIPIVIGESDPEGCAACGMATDPQNAYRNGTMYSGYTAAAFARKYELATRYNANLLGAVTWAFEFENQPWFYGFRDLATNGVDKPVLNVFRMFGLMGGQLADAISNRQYPLQTILDSGVRGDQSDIGVLATTAKRSAAIMLWNYHDVDSLDQGENIEVHVLGIPAAAATVTTYLIDSRHSNAYEAWKQMGSPQQPSADQVAALEKAGQLQQADAPKKYTLADGKLTLKTNLERQGVALLKLSW